MRYYLDFEKRLEPYERRLDEIKRFHSTDDPAYLKEIESLEKKIRKLEKEIYGSLSDWQKFQLSRHPLRPHMLDYVHALFEDFVELHGDRKFRDDPAMVCGFAKFEGIKIAVVGQQKGKDLKEMAYRNFGMAHPEGYRKAMRIMELADRWRKPLVTFIDTPGAYPGVEAEERGIAEAIASSIYLMFSISIPIVTLVIGEGGSGGALAIGIGDRVLMLENASYSVISPEGCAAILFRDGKKGPEACEALKLASHHLLKLGVVDEIVKEPFGGAHRNWDETFSNVREALLRNVTDIIEVPPQVLKEKRVEKYKKMGRFKEAE